MATKVPDIERVDRIIEAYQKLLKQVTLSVSTQKSIISWLYKNNIFLGSAYYNHDLLYEELPKLKKNANFRKAYKKFVANIMVSPESSKSSGIQKNIAILFTGCYGGGHKTAAMAIGQHFEKMGHQVKLIDVDQIEDRYSPVVNGYTKAQIYQEVYQKEGNIKKAHFLENEIRRIRPIESNRHLQDIKEMLIEFDSEYIFAVAHHRPELGYLSYQLGVPMCYIHTDYIFHKRLVPILHEQTKLKNPLIKFSTLTDKGSFFKNIEEILNFKQSKFPSEIKKQLVKFGFPVRSSFAPVTVSELHSIRKELNIPVNAIVCKLAMGQNALAHEIQDILQKIQKEKIKTVREVHLFVICGKNEQLKVQLEKSLKQSSVASNKLHIHILGFLNEQEMARIDQAANVWISKPGGSTCAELLRTQKQMLYVTNANHPWEKLNAEYLKELKLADKLSSKKPILEQIYKRLAVHEEINLSKLPHINWQEHATRLIYSSN